MTTDYGDDFSGIDDLDSELSSVSSDPDDPRALVEALACRLGSTPGSMEDDPTWGYDLTALIGDTIDEAEVINKIEEQCRFDDRVGFAKASLNFVAGLLEVSIQIQPVKGKSFEFVMGVYSLSVDVLRIKEAA